MDRGTEFYRPVVSAVFNSDRSQSPREGAEFRIPGVQGLLRAGKTVFGDGQWRTPVRRVEERS